MTLARSYEPFGSTLTSAGNGSSAFAFAGEMRDLSGLTFLRARYLSTIWGRFFQKDPSRQERNLYEYAASNPILLSDPSGLLFWRYRGGAQGHIGNPTSNISNKYAHPWIEYWLEQQNGFWQTHLEFPGGSVSNIDAIVFDRLTPAGFGPSPIYFSAPADGSVFEIEPADPPQIIKGWLEIQTKLGFIKGGVWPFVHRGNLPTADHWAKSRPLAPYSGAQYDLSLVNWKYGASLSPQHGRGPVRVDPNVIGGTLLQGRIPNAFWILLVTDGLILYIDELSLPRNVLAGGAFAIGAYILDRYSRARQSPKGGELPAPAFILIPIEPTLHQNDSCTVPNKLEDLTPIPLDLG